MQKADEHDLYSRGKYRLQWDKRRDGSLRSPFLQIVWYDPARRRLCSVSTGTSDLPAAEDELDRLYLRRERGRSICPGCGRPFDGDSRHPISQAIADYLLAREDRASIDALKARLAHVTDWLQAIGREDLSCEEMDEDRIAEFRQWSSEQDVIEGTRNPVRRKRAAGTTEASVRTLAAAINFAFKRKDTLSPAGFTAKPPRDVSRTPTYRADVDTLAAMFRYCIDPQPPKGEVWTEKMRDRQRLHRRNLLRFLQASVATWARPDAVHDISTAPERDQWISTAGVLQLNPKGRRQTKKYRPAVPVPPAFAKLLDTTNGFFVTVQSVRKAFEAMLGELGLPRERETGLKLIRRSVSHIARKQIGEAQWAQGEMMLGHRKASISDLYALPDPANLGRALEATNELIAEIEMRCSGAFQSSSPERHRSAKYTLPNEELEMA